MNLLAITGIALALAMDAFAVSVAVGLALDRTKAPHVVRLAVYFGFFQFLMPIVGWAGGKEFRAALAGFEHWLSFGLLMLIGANMIRDAGKEKELWESKDPTRGLTALMLSLATSIDALGIGVVLAARKVNIWHASVVIGLVAAAMTALGMTVGRRVGRKVELKVGMLGGVVLIALALFVMGEHYVPALLHALKER